MEAARHLEPLRQGKIDNLCGIYSILNAVRLAVWPTTDLNHARSKHLFQHAVAMLQRENLLQQVLRHGMDDKVWGWLCDQVLRCFEHKGGVRLQRVPILRTIKKSELPTALAIIAERLAAGEPVLVQLLGSYNHFTVISGQSQSRLILFDSYGYRWISLTACELHRRSATCRHQIVRRSAFALVASTERAHQLTHT